MTTQEQPAAAAPDRERADGYEFDNPSWQPLLALVGGDESKLADWMWMFSSRGIHAYKHRDTRRYVLLDTQVYAYRYLRATDSYVRLADPQAAFNAALEPV